MSWGDSWGDHASSNAQTIAKAFFEGRKCKRGNAETDGVAYRLFGNMIARRNPHYDRAEEIAAKLVGEAYMVRIEFSWCGRVDKTTQRHFDALGLKADCGYKDTPPQFEGREVDSILWYTPERIAELPLWKAAPPTRRGESFVNVTLPLFT